MTDTTQRPVGKMVAIVAAVLFGIYAVYSVSTKPAESDVPTVPRGEAWNSCKEAVTDLLRNPESADFRLLSTDFAEKPDGGWSIAGSLTAVNDFNVEQDIGFNCSVDPDGTVTARVA